MLNDLSPKYWNDRYLQDDFSWDIGHVSTPLKTYIDQLPDKELSILIPGAGNAYEAEYLFNEGFKNVYVCDLAPAPLQNLQKRCPEFNPKHLLESDFFELNDFKFDLIIEQTFFCAINPTMRKKYAKKIADLLQPNGKLVGLLFDDQLNTDKPPFGGSKEEYLNYFNQDFEIHTFEKCYNSIKPREGRELFIILKKIDFKG